MMIDNIEIERIDRAIAHHLASVSDSLRDELAQTVWLKILIFIERNDGNLSRVRSGLVARICRFTIIDFGRKYRPVISQESYQAESISSDIDSVDITIDFLDKLAAVDRQYIEARLAGRSDVEIAHILGVTKSCIRNIRRRAIEALRKYIQ